MEPSGDLCAEERMMVIDGVLCARMFIQGIAIPVQRYLR